MGLSWFDRSSEPLTPGRLALLALIYLDAQRGTRCHRSFARFMETSEIPDRVSELTKHLPDPELGRQLVRFLGEFDSVDALCTFYDGAASLIGTLGAIGARGAIDPTSPVGIFVRREVVAYQSALFGSLARLFRGLGPFLAEQGHSASHENSSTTASTAATPSISGAKAKASPSSLLKVPDPPLSVLIEEKRESEAIDAIHTFFDDYDDRSRHNLFSSASPLAILDSAVPPLQALSASELSDLAVARYAVLNIAVASHLLGRTTPALVAIDEAIRVAQRKGDHVCLVHALSWLHRILPGGQVNLMAQCYARARALKLHSVAAETSVAMAKYALESGNAGPLPRSCLREWVAVLLGRADESLQAVTAPEESSRIADQLAAVRASANQAFFLCSGDGTDGASRTSFESHEDHDLPGILEELSRASGLGFVGHEALADLCLCNLRIRLSAAKGASAKISRLMPRILTSAPASTKGRAHLLLAMCILAEGNSEDHLHLAVIQLNRAAEMIPQSKLTFYLLARVYNSLKHEMERNKAAEMFAFLSTTQTALE